MTVQRLYDTAYTERYLGHPDEDPEPYRICSLIDDAPTLRRPLLIIHGLTDDNVVVAHTLALSGALTAAGRPHRAPALGRHAHDAAGGGRGEQAPPRARLPHPSARLATRAGTRIPDELLWPAGES